MGIKLLSKHNFEVVILDVILPKDDGFAVCRQIRSLRIHVPILMLTALDATEDKVNGLDAGADDYLSKPFKFQELLARIRALSRRRMMAVVDPEMRVSNLLVNLNTQKVNRGGLALELTPREYHLLVYLMKNKGKVLSRTEIAEEVWGISFDRGTNVVDVYIIDSYCFWQGLRIKRRYIGF